MTQPGQAGLPDVYASQLENITLQLMAAQPQAKLVFAGTTAYMCSAGQDGCVVNLNNQAARIMDKYKIPMLNLHDAITSQCGPAGTTRDKPCFKIPKCFCPHCANGGGYDFLAEHVIVPALTNLLPSPPPPPPPPSPSPPCKTDANCSLNGVCTAAGQCQCDAPWGGPRCGLLQFNATSDSRGRDLYSAGDAVHNTWNGPIVKNDHTGEFTMYAPLYEGNVPTNPHPLYHPVSMLRGR